MNKDQRGHFRAILLAWKQELMEEVDRTVGHMKEEAANFADPADRATQEEEFSLELRTRDRERKLIKKIDEALNDIDSGDYGYCEACGIEIGIPPPGSPPHRHPVHRLQDPAGDQGKADGLRAVASCKWPVSRVKNERRLRRLSFFGVPCHLRLATCHSPHHH